MPSRCADYHSGDVNGSGDITIHDLQCYILINLAILGGGAPPTCLQFESPDADLNCSGVVDVSDVTLSLKLALGLTSDLQVFDPGYVAGGTLLHYLCQQTHNGRADAWSCPHDSSGTRGIALVSGASCALDGEGTAWCWGQDKGGAQGNFGRTGDQTQPDVSHRNGNYSKIAGQFSQTGAFCAISSLDGTLWCWGDNFGGRVYPADENTDFLTAPTRLGATSDDWLDVDVGRDHACAIKSGASPSLWCWGCDDVLQLGVASTPSASTFLPREVPNPTSGSADWQSVVAGEGFSCGLLDNGDAYCWGSNQFGQLGFSTTGNHSPTLVPGSHSWRQLAAHADTVCGITTADALYCWGRNKFNFGGSAGTLAGFVGANDGSSASISTPTLINSGQSYEKVAMGRWHSCAITKGSGHALRCWGADHEEQVGNGVGTTNVLVPTQIGSATDWVDVALGEDHSCGLREVAAGDFKVYCWGDGGSGELGTGLTVDSAIPIQTNSLVANCDCGDGECDTTNEISNHALCYLDCNTCGDNICTTYAESPSTCSADCDCGDGHCQSPENNEPLDPDYCATDCGATCGNKSCEAAESAATCPGDCFECGDGLCYVPEEVNGIGQSLCGVDCNCGDFICDATEDIVSCSQDCGYCGDGVCGYGEDSVNCPQGNSGDCP